MAEQNDEPEFITLDEAARRNEYERRIQAKYLTWAFVIVVAVFIILIATGACVGAAQCDDLCTPDW